MSVSNASRRVSREDVLGREYQIKKRIKMSQQCGSDSSNMVIIT